MLVYRRVPTMGLIIKESMGNSTSTGYEHIVAHVTLLKKTYFCWQKIIV